MKKILVPVDFSRCSANALIYAASIAEHLGAELSILHVYHVPVPATDLPMIDVSITDMEKKSYEDMHKMISALQQEQKWKAPLLFQSRTGIASFEINSESEENDVDLIIMGMRGRTTVADKFFGSTATEMIKRSPCPLLMIPENAVFQKPENIAVACDFNHPEDVRKISAVKNFIDVFKSRLMAFSIVKDDTIPGKADVYNVLESLLSNYNHSTHLYTHADVSEGILRFTEEHNAGVLVMFHHSHNIFARMFTPAYSKEISFSIPIPLFVINENSQG